MADIKVESLAGGAVRSLREQVRGRVITAEDEGYDEARAVHNGMFDRRPLAVLEAEQVGDVIAAVDLAREHGLDLSVRGGMHSGPGYGTNDDGLVIDMSQMRTVRVDPGNKTARAGAGATWGDFNYATHAFGLATTGGIISTTGISGLTLGGGIGYLARGCGLTIDNLISADLVTADGKFLTASERENEDLFWGLRGGGGNFGVVTSFEFRLHEVDPMVQFGFFFWSLDQGTEALRLARADDAASRLTLAQFKAMVREQFFMLLLEPEASLAAIPKLLPASEDQRREGLAIIRSVLSASAEISGESATRFDRVTQLFGLTAEQQAKAS